MIQWEPPNDEKTVFFSLFFLSNSAFLFPYHKQDQWVQQTRLEQTDQTYSTEQPLCTCTLSATRERRKVMAG